MYALARNCRFAFRQLRKARGLSLAVVLTLALGIGATTAIFSLVEGILLRPLPFSRSRASGSAGRSSGRRPEYPRDGSRNRRILERDQRIFFSWRIHRHQL